MRVYREPARFRGGGGLPPLTPLTKVLLFGLLGVFVAQLVANNFLRVPLFDLLALRVGHFGLLTPVQLVTWFVATPPTPGSILPFAITMLFLWWMVGPMEQLFGTKNTVLLCAAGVVGGGLAALIVGLVFGLDGLLFGPEGIFLALIAALAWVYRDRGEVSLFGLFSMKAIHVLYLALGFSVLGFLASRNVSALVADLGSIAAGIGFVEWTRRGRGGRPGRRTKRKAGGKKRKRSSHLHAVPRPPAPTDDDEERPRWLN